MTDKKDDKTNVVVGPWGNEPVENNGEWIKKNIIKHQIKIILTKTIKKNLIELKL